MCLTVLYVKCVERGGETKNVVQQQNIIHVRLSCPIERQTVGLSGVERKKKTKQNKTRSVGKRWLTPSQR